MVVSTKYPNIIFKLFSLEMHLDEKIQIQIIKWNETECIVIYYVYLWVCIYEIVTQTLTQISVHYKIKDDINVIINQLWLSNCTHDKQTEHKPRLILQMQLQTLVNSYYYWAKLYILVFISIRIRALKPF